MYLWILVAGSITAFLTSWTIGANDVANSFATSVGAKVLTLRQAMAIAAIFECGGAILMGSHVTDTIRKGIVSTELFQDHVHILMFGMLCSSIATGIWLAIATYFKAPVSTTHSVIGAIIGFALAYHGVSAINWPQVYLIIASWVISPLISGVVTLSIFLFIKYTALRRDNPVQNALRIFPLMVFLTLSINTFFIVYKGTPALGLKNTPLWLGLVVAAALGLVGALITYLVDRFHLRQKLNNEMNGEMNEMNGEMNEMNDETRNADEDLEMSLAPESALASELGQKKKKNLKTIEDQFEYEEYHASAEKLFSYLQVFTACMSSFAHGANDVANSIGPFAAIYSIYMTGSAASKSEVPIWILIIGGVGIVIGLAFWGHHVIERMGKELVKITPSRGFSMELGSSLAVVTASRLGIPVSTTHCQVGSIIGGGLADGKTNISWKTFLKVVFGWLVTLPVTAGISAALFSFGFYAPQ